MQVPMDVFAVVLTPFCAPEDLARLSQVSHDVQGMADANSVWHRSFCRGECGSSQCALHLTGGKRGEEGMGVCKQTFARRREAALAALAGLGERSGRTGLQRAMESGRSAALFGEDEDSMVNFLHRSMRLSPKARSLIAERGGLLEPFLSRTDFSLMELDQGLRKLVRWFVLPPEAGRIDGVCQLFARVFSRQHAFHPLYSCADRCHILTMSILMLNTDLHSRNVRHKMHLDTFVRNVTPALVPGFLAAEDMPAGFLEGIYRRINEQALVFGATGLFEAPESRQPQGRCAIM